MSEAHAPMGKTPNPLVEWWSNHVVSTVPHREVVERVQEDAGWSTHYVFMTLMSAGISVLGLLLSSPAVVIGAMLISPLMGPIIGVGFGLATFDSAEIRRTLMALGIGIGLAVLFCALIVTLSPLQTVTDEIATRTRPNLFDLLVALFSGLAGSYAMIRGRHGTIVGVAIATALMPPLAVVGFGLATLNWTVFLGAGLLFLTNLATIAASAAVLARLYGFAGNLSPRQTGLQALLILAMMAGLAVPLGLTLKNIAWEALASRQSQDIIAGYFGPEARISALEIDYDAEPVDIEAAVFTPAYKRGAEGEAERRLERLLGKPVSISIAQSLTSNGDPEAMEVAAARGTGDRASLVMERLALVAGVTADQVLVDRTAKRALVRAAPLPGADLASYRALEQRVAATQPSWSVTLIPPPAALPELSFEGDELDERGREAAAIAVWGARRLQLPLGVSGRGARAEAALTALSEGGAVARAVEGAGDGVALTWVAPEPRE